MSIQRPTSVMAKRAAAFLILLFLSTSAVSGQTTRDTTVVKSPDSKKNTAPKPAFTVAPLPRALLPHKRIVVYYGNPRSTRMGVMGEYPQDVMLKMLSKEVDAFNVADPETPVQPGLHLIATVAQNAPGKDRLYRAQMSDSLISYWCDLADSLGYVIFLDIQIGRSTLDAEIKPLLPFLRRKHVHLAIDPEFAMKGDGVPGKKIGSLDASQINSTINVLADLVQENNIPPKVLVIHRFTQRMVTNSRLIKPVPEVQVVMNMDGFGAPHLKRDSYRAYVRMQPVQFTGFKLFYKNDKPIMTRKEVVELDPSPVFITFQ